MRELSVAMGGTGTSCERAYDLFNILASETGLDSSIIPHILHVATGESMSDAEVAELIALFSKDGHFSVEAFKEMLLSDKLRTQEAGRHYVALSLAEAETVRRIMHVRGATVGVEMRLRLLPAGFATIDHVTPTSVVVPKEENDASYQAVEARQCLRYFDGELTYTEADIGVLVRALQRSTCRRRQLFFEQVMGCRRRARQKWETTPLAKIFSLRSEFHLLKQRAEIVRMRLGISAAALTQYEAFQAFNTSRNGLLKPSELFAAMEYLGIVGVQDVDVIDMMRTCDADGDGNLSWGEFAQMLRWNDETLDGLDKRVLASGVIPTTPVDVESIELVPKAAESIAATWKEMDEDAARKAEDEMTAYRAVEIERAGELEREQDARDREAGISPNPEVSPGRLCFDFAVNRLPKQVKAFGVVDYRAQPGNSYALNVDPRSYVVLPLEGRFAPNGGGNPAVGRLNQYTVAIYAKFPTRPPALATLFRTAPPTSTAEGTEINFDSNGKIGTIFGCDEMYGVLPVARWAHITCTVTCSSECKVYIDGQGLVGMLAEQFAELLSIDGPMSLSLKGGVAIFGSSDQRQMAGGVIRSCEVYDRAFNEFEVEGLYQNFQVLNQWQCHVCTSKNSWDSDTCKVCQNARLHDSNSGGGGSGSNEDGTDLSSPTANIKVMVQAMGYAVTDEMISTALADCGGDADMAIGMVVDRAVQNM